MILLNVTRNANIRSLVNVTCVRTNKMCFPFKGPFGGDCRAGLAFPTRPARCALGRDGNARLGSGWGTPPPQSTSFSLSAQTVIWKTRLYPQPPSHSSHGPPPAPFLACSSPRRPYAPQARSPQARSPQRGRKAVSTASAAEWTLSGTKA